MGKCPLIAIRKVKKRLKISGFKAHYDAFLAHLSGCSQTRSVGTETLASNNH